MKIIYIFKVQFCRKSFELANFFFATQNDNFNILFSDRSESTKSRSFVFYFKYYSSK